MKQLMHTYIKSLNKLWNTCESLHFNRIKLKRLPLIFAMPFAVIVADMQYSFLGLQGEILGLDYSTALQIAYSIGAISVLLLRNRHVFTFIRVSMGVTAVFLILCFLLPLSGIKQFSAVMGFFGLGGCAISAALFYCASLQNTERLYGVMLLAASSPIFIFIKNAGISSTVTDNIIPIIFIALMLCFLYSIKREDLEQLQTPGQTGHNGSIACELTYAGCYFFVTYFQYQIFLIQNLVESIPYLIGQIISVVLVFIIQLVFKRSIWHMWNIYFILTTIGMLGLLLDTTGLLIQASLVTCGIATGIGYITAFYMGAGIIKRHFSMSFFKKTLFVFIALTMVSILLSGIAASLFPDKLLPITAAISGLSLIVVIILSPVIYKNLFSHDWMDDFAKEDMVPAGDDFNGCGFTDREKEVCRLLLDGYTLGK